MLIHMSMVIPFKIVIMLHSAYARTQLDGVHYVIVMWKESTYKLCKL